MICRQHEQILACVHGWMLGSAAFFKTSGAQPRTASTIPNMKSFLFKSLGPGKPTEERHLVMPEGNESGQPEADPKTDLSILRENCNRMAHFVKGTALTLHELKVTRPPKIRTSAKNGKLNLRK